MLLQRSIPNRFETKRYRLRTLLIVLALVAVAWFAYREHCYLRMRFGRFCSRWFSYLQMQSHIY